MTADVKKQKKQVLVDPLLYRQMKAKMYLQGKTFSKWLEEKMQEEVRNEQPTA